MTSDGIVEIEHNPRERRIYDRARRLVIEPRVGAAVGLRDVLLLLPDLLILMSRLMREPRVSRLSKVLALAGMGYVLSPVDFLPVLIFGPLGLVDDLLVASAVISRLIRDVHPDVVRSHWPGHGDALEAISRVTEWGENQVMGRLKDVSNWRLFGGPSRGTSSRSPRH